MIYSIIPSKKKSSRLPTKNTFKFKLNGTPLIEYTINAIKNAGLVPILFTDEESIPEYISGVRTIKRTPKTTHCKATMKDTVKEYVKKMKLTENDVILLTYLTCPFRTAEDIDEAIKVFYSSNAKSLQSVTPVNYRPYGLMYKAEENVYKCLHNQKNYYQKQNMPTLYKANGAIYIFKVSELDKLNNQMFNGETLGFELDEIHGLDIDTELDIMLAEKILENGYDYTSNQLSDKGRSEAKCVTNRTWHDFISFEASWTQCPCFGHKRIKA